MTYSFDYGEVELDLKVNVDSATLEGKIENESVTLTLIPGAFGEPAFPVGAYRSLDVPQKVISFFDILEKLIAFRVALEQLEGMQIKVKRTKDTPPAGPQTFSGLVYELAEDHLCIFTDSFDRVTITYRGGEGE